MTATDREHLETRLLLIAEMLERAVAEVRREIDHIRGTSNGLPEPSGEQQ